ncbi:PIN2/TERF1-interacting telomerase inhibitor 1, partial [Characodon lateralis]|nr:PIN2/TERF1-interacting telomerase inhibitor 1 [Characodon lateralis]
MLERMGWSKGKGLGRSEQGSTDHIKVKVKNNNHGLGANAIHEDNWIAHQDEFNELLAQLNDHHGQNSSNEVPPDQMKSFSLEEKSKTSKKRVHYTKFTKEFVSLLGPEDGDPLFEVFSVRFQTDFGAVRLWSEYKLAPIRTNYKK